MAISRTEVFINISADLLSRGYGVRFRTKGASMYPTIKDGETVRVETVEPRDVRRGDIILYKTSDSSGGGGVIAHRVVRVKKNRGNLTSFVLRGDASETCDLPIAPERIIGKVVSVEREGGAIDLASKKANALRIARLCASRVKAVVRNQGSRLNK
jgi:signal peptidase I